MQSTIINAHAKINLTLYVGNVLENGYHNIDTVMHTVELHDIITLSKASRLSLAVTEGTAPSGEDNLMWRAAVLFAKEAQIDPKFHLELKKRIPSQAGLGGGSSDAAAVLKGLNQMFDYPLDMEILHRLAASLGADVPFFLYEGAARCRGIGTDVTLIQGWNGIPAIIVKPDEHISTAIAYAQIDMLKEKRNNFSDEMVLALKSKNLKLLQKYLMNHFEEALFSKHSVLLDTSVYLHQWGYPCGMSGSGAAFFILLNNSAKADEIITTISMDKPTWFVAKTETII